MDKSLISRRKFAAAASTLLAGSVITGPSLWGMPTFINKLGRSGSRIKGVKVGVITYSFRSLPDQSAEATLQYVLDSGISAIELMGGPAEEFAGAPKNPVNFRSLYRLRRKQRAKEELTAEEEQTLKEASTKRKEYEAELAKWRSMAPMSKFEKFGKMYQKAGVEIYAFKPSAFGRKNTEAEIEYGMKAAKALGASHVTLEHPSNDAHTLKLGKMAEKIGIKVGYHGHEQQTPTFWDTALDQSPANALNIDIGHYVAAGNTDPLGIIRAKHDRIASMHMKDRQTPKNGKKNLSWGEGDTPLKEVLQLVRDEKYAFPVTIELEYQIPEDSGPVEEVNKCLEFCRRALS